MSYLPGILFLFLISAFATGCPGLLSDNTESTPQDLVEGSAKPSPSDDCSDIYIAPNGSDIASGDSPQEALASLSAAAKAVGPGCSVKVLPGIYHQAVHISGFRKLSAPITIEGITVDADDELPVFDGEDSLATGIEISESGNINLRNMSFAGYTDQGIYIWESQDIVLEGLLVTRNGGSSKNPDSEGEGFGINVDTASNVTIQNNTATFNGPNDERYEKGIVGTGINTYQMDDSVIENNLVIGNLGGGILVEDSVNVEVVDNYIENTNADVTHDGWWDAGIWLDGGSDVIIRDNVIRETLGPAIQISDEDNQSSSRHLIQNNTLENNFYGFFIWNLGDCPYPDEAVASFERNEISNSSREDVLCSAEGYPDI